VLEEFVGLSLRNVFRVNAELLRYSVTASLRLVVGRRDGEDWLAVS
jgi:hypothetical protein